MQMVMLTGAARELQEEVVVVVMAMVMMIMIGLLLFSVNRHQPRSYLAETHQRCQCLAPLAWVGLASPHRQS